MRTRDDAFAAVVEDALDHLSEPIELWNHPLAPLARAGEKPGVAASGPSGAGEQLRQKLLTAIDTLKPPEGTGTSSAAARRHRLLELRYAQGMSPTAVQREVGISKSEYYREIRQAVTAVVAVIRDTWPGVNGMDSAAPTGRAGGMPSAGVARDGTSPAQPAGTGLTGGAAGELRGTNGSNGIGGSHALQAVPALPVPTVPASPLPRQAPALPRRLTRFVGRSKELTRLGALFGPATGWSSPTTRDAPRLVTLLGPGGTGKTRLAVEFASRLSGEPGVQVWFVDLTTVGNPALFLPAVANALGLSVGDEEFSSGLVAEQLRTGRQLVVLDNFEHVLDAAPQVRDLMHDCPDLRMLVTSRSALRIEGEREFPLSPLRTPDAQRLIPLPQLIQYDAVRLFVDRARAIDPEFELNAENASQVTRICALLDGLPLAIELAASRTRLLSLEAILERMRQRLALLSGGGARDLPARHRTLRAALDWSYDLLVPEEQTLLGRLSLFHGSFTLDAAEAVCDLGDLPDGVLNGLEGLVSHSLIQRDERPTRGRSGRGGSRRDGEVRFQMLEILREYAAERFADDPRAPEVLNRYVDYYLAQGERAERELLGGGQIACLEGLEREHENLRIALDRVAASGDAAQRQRGLAAAAALWRFWNVRGSVTEARTALQGVLDAARSLPDTRAKARAANVAGYFAWVAGEFAPARAFHAEAMAIARAAGDQTEIAYALLGLGNVSRSLGAPTVARELCEDALAILRDIATETMRADIAYASYTLAHAVHDEGDYAAAREWFAESLRLFGDLDDTWGETAATAVLGFMAYLDDDDVTARDLYRKSLRGAQRLGNRRGMATTLRYVGMLAERHGQHKRARASYEHCLALRRETGDRHGSAEALLSLGGLDIVERRYADAASHLGEALRLYRDLAERRMIAVALVAFARLAHASGAQSHEHAARFLGSADAILDPIRAQLSPQDQTLRTEIAGDLARGLGKSAYQSAYTQGRERALEATIQEALSLTIPKAKAG